MGCSGSGLGASVTSGLSPCCGVTTFAVCGVCTVLTWVVVALVWEPV